MGDIKNLTQKEAIEKMKEIAEKIDICMFCTQPQKFPMETRPMSTQKVEEDGSIWFMSSIESHKNEELADDDHLQLIYSHPGSMTFMTVHGTATISRDRKKIEELWKPHIKAWFTEGKDDPRITLIKVTPNEAYYWDTRHNKMIAFLKMMASAATGKTMDDGVEGVIKPGVR
jgi:general stress protein 26